MTRLRRTYGQLTLWLFVVACVTPRGSSDRTAPTFAADIAPLLHRACVSCHNPAGSAPFSLITYDDARARADLIARVTSQQSMPPWLPEPGYARFVGERRLTAEEIRLLARWAAASAPEGDHTRTPVARPVLTDGWWLGEPDLVLDFPAVLVPAGGREQYRNLVVSVPAGDTLWVRAAELRPAAGRLVHHARLMVDTTVSSRQLDAEDPAPGFDGMKLRSAASNPDGYFVAWTPGKLPARATADLAWPLPGGADLVLQLHIRPGRSAERVQPRVALHLAEAPPARRTSLVMLGSESIEIPPGDSAHEIVDEFELPVPVEVLGVYPHAHYLAKRILGYATLPGGARRWLIRIDDWDFNWQDEYRYSEPLALPAGTVLTMRYVYDNSAANPHNASHPPRRVRYGSESTDEMADLILHVLPGSASDRLTLEERLQWSYYSKRMAAEARVLRSLGDSLAERGRLDEALDAYRRALRVADDAGVMAATARILIRQTNAAAAVIVAERAAALSKEPAILDVLASAYDAAGRHDEARAAARGAVESAERHGLRELADSLRARWQVTTPRRR